MDGGDKHAWSLQDAKNHFSEVVRAAERDGPQTVTRHGKPAAVVISTEEYERLKDPNRRRYKNFGELLLAMPQGGDDDIWDNLRQPMTMRDIEF